MPANPEASDKKEIGRYRVYRESDHGLFELVGKMLAFDARQALAAWLDEEGTYPREGERFLVRRAQIKGEARLFKLRVPSRSFDIVDA